MTHDFGGVAAIDGITTQQDPDYITITYTKKDFKTIQLALRIADRLRKGDVSDEMYDVGWKEGEDPHLEDWPYGNPEDVFKAMSQQLFKELEDV